MDQFLAENRGHVAAVGLLLCVQFFVRDVQTGYYRAVGRPRLVASGARPCADHVPLSRKYVPADCDLVIESTSGAGIEQQYHDRRGAEVTTVTWRSGQWASTGTTYSANQLSMVLPFLAFAVFFVAQIRKVVRTGAFWTWQLAKHPPDRFEKLVYLYAFPIFLSGIVLPVLGASAR